VQDSSFPNLRTNSNSLGSEVMKYVVKEVAMENSVRRCSSGCPENHHSIIVPHTSTKSRAIPVIGGGGL
jgi:hypothetical protein